MILVVSFPQDDHTAVVVERLRALGHDVVLLDTSTLGSTTSLELGHATGVPADLRLVTPDGTHDLRHATTGWWRRLRGTPVDPSITDPAAAEFASSELAEVFEGVVAALPLRWVNDPTSDAAAHHKPWQWAVAADLGLTLARTVVTRDPARAREFVAATGPGRVVTKAFIARADAWRETHVLDDADVERLDQVRFAPTILQEYVPGVDLRVTMVDGEAFTTEIDATGTSLPSDMRMVLDEAAVRPITLPDHVLRRVRALMDRLGLVYGAVDLRRRPDGEHVFFEVNPAGLWQFCEDLTGLPITDAVVTTLARRDRAMVAA
ncbi:MvdC/MvdD family ATP grasp protein [Cellulosimicrobium arenosum]|uniref:Alpha-L-glutamate ligase n=1 Tax=Cellulosimicrobium arenosum TaxID=2708133 RepID=A0A927G6E1_9MICO|nr:alpha-L-glutamate ligase [Cellulosimicrobium arenosum]MBD8077774.1 alpha-L-glutamate ligase [Cellulosimicrobium arenosum]